MAAIDGHDRDVTSPARLLAGEFHDVQTEATRKEWYFSGSTLLADVLNHFQTETARQGMVLLW